MSTDHHRVIWHTCEAVRKRAYPTKADAKTARKRTPGAGLQIYKCQYGDHFHLGHPKPGKDRETYRIVRVVNPAGKRT